MEYSQTLCGHRWYAHMGVLILILMEYSQTGEIKEYSLDETRLNPYSNGILTNMMYMVSVPQLSTVLILILMEYSQTCSCKNVTHRN